MSSRQTCRFGRHRWTQRQGVNHLTCFRCSAVRAYGKTLRCRLGRHRWAQVRKDGDEMYFQCFFCRKYGGSPPPFFPAGLG